MAADEPDLSIFENKSGLAEDLKFLASMPELCDVTFLVGETREPVCAVKVNDMTSLVISLTSLVVLECFDKSREKNVENTKPQWDVKRKKLEHKSLLSIPGNIGITLSSISKDVVSNSVAATTQEREGTRPEGDQQASPVFKAEQRTAA